MKCLMVDVEATKITRCFMYAQYELAEKTIRKILLLTIHYAICAPLALLNAPPFTSYCTPTQTPTPLTPLISPAAYLISYRPITLLLL
jgi:hypothetical protein